LREKFPQPTALPNNLNDSEIIQQRIEIHSIDPIARNKAHNSLIIAAEISHFSALFPKMSKYKLFIPIHLIQKYRVQKRYYRQTERRA
jgi:hypothetical protein